MINYLAERLPKLGEAVDVGEEPFCSLRLLLVLFLVNQKPVYKYI